MITVYDIIFTKKGNNYEESYNYEDFDNARADYLYMTQEDRDKYGYVILREIKVIDKFRSNK